MSTRKPPTKKALFFQVFALQDGATSAPIIPWADALENLRTLASPERFHEGTLYELHRLSDEAMPVVGVHKGLRHDFLTSIGEASVEDALEGSVRDQDGKLLAHSTAIVILPDLNVVAVTRGSMSSPQAPGVVEELLKLFVSSDTRWHVTPLPDPDKIEALRQAEGIIEFSTKMTTVRNLFTPDSATGVIALGDEFAEKLGGDIEIDIVVKLSKEARVNKGIRETFRRYVLADLPRVATDAKNRPKALAVLPDGLTQELNLTAEKMSIDVQLAQTDLAERRFSDLVNALRNVVGEQQTRIRDILGR